MSQLFVFKLERAVIYFFFYLLILVLSRVVFAEPLCEGLVFKGSSDAVLHLDLSQGVRGRHQFHHA